METSAVVLSGFICRKHLFSSSTRATVTDVSPESAVLKNGGNQITVRVENDQLSKGDEVLLLKVGQSFVIQKLSQQQNAAEYADSLDRQKLHTSSDLRTLLLILSEHPQKQVSALAREALEVVSSSFLYLHGSLADSAKALQGTLCGDTAIGKNSVSLEKILCKELNSIKTHLKEISGSDVKLFALPSNRGKPGFFSFPSHQSFCAWLRDNGVKSPSRFLENISTDHLREPLYVRVTSGSEIGREVVLLTKPKLEAEIREFLSHLKSPQLRQIDPKLFQQILSDNGTTLSESHIKEIDALLVSVQKEHGLESIVSPRGLQQSLTHLLHLSSNLKDSYTVSPRAAVLALTQVARDLFVHAPSLGGKEGNVELPSLSMTTNGPQQAQASPLDAFDKFLHQYIHRLGLTLESRLASGSLEPHPVDLKSTLLQLMSVLDQTESKRMPLEASVQTQAASNHNTGQVAAALEQMPVREMVKLRQDTHQMMQRIEALQFLARPVTTSEGEQQIIAVPMHIDGECTELRLQIVKKDGRSSGKRKRRQYSLNLTVQPRALGEVSATIRWEENKSCHIGISFERTSTHNWFRRRLQPFKQALQSIGLPAIQVEMSTRKEQCTQSNDSHWGHHNGILDITG